MKHILQRLTPFLISFGLLWLAGLICLLQLGYEESFLYLNGIRSYAADLLMPHLTHFGDGLFISVLVGLWLAQKRPEMVLNVIIGMSLIGVLVYLGKFWIFRDWHRPVMVFLHRIEFSEIPLRRLFHYTFPSGHSAAAAGALVFLAYDWGKTPVWSGLTLGGLAALFAYTRLYIGVHFLGDILAGTALGVFVAIGSIHVLEPRLKRWLGPNDSQTWRRWQRGLTVLAYLLLPISLSWIFISEYLG
ncbi:MAG: phosphatase PAP2 family protein [Bacteroidota bacterium]